MIDEIHKGLAGFPATVVFEATFLVTTEPAPTTEPSPTVIPGNTVTFAPNHASFSMTIGRPPTMVFRRSEGSFGWIAVTMLQLGPIITLSPIFIIFAFFQRHFVSL